MRSATKADSSQNVHWAVDETASTLPSGDCVFVDKVVRQSLTSLHSSLSSGKPFSKNICKKNTVFSTFLGDNYSGLSFDLFQLIL